MKRVSLLRSTTALAVVAFALAGSYGCSKKLTTNPNFTRPEGVFSANARLMVYRERPVAVTAIHQVGRIFVFDSSFAVVNYPPGTVVGTLMDATAATGFELMRKQGGGYEPAKDFALTPVGKWLDTKTEEFEFTDVPPASPTPATYVARGLIGGTANGSSVLTNEATVSPDSVTDLTYTSPVQTPDSLFTITWAPVPGATTYWVHIFLFRGDIRTNYEKLGYGVPAPIATGKVHTYVLARQPGTATSFSISGPGPDVIHYEPIPRHQNYFIRVSAVDALGNLVACTPGKPDTVLVGSESYVYKPAAEKICVGCLIVR
jgi:hypothetical protein